MRIMNKALLVSLGLFCLGQYLSIAVGNIFLGLAIIFALIVEIKNKTEFKKYKLSKTEKGILIFIGVSFLLCFTSLDIKHSLNVFANNYIYRMMPLFIVMVLGIGLLKTKQAVDGAKIIINLIKISILGYTIDTCYAIYQAVVLNISRPNGFFGNAMTYAGWDCLFVPILFILFMETNGKVELNKKLLYLGALFLSVVGTVLNGTRGALLAIVIVLLILITYYGFNGYKKICATVLTLCFALPITFGVLYPNNFKSLRIVRSVKTIDLNIETSHMERFYIWKGAIHMIKDYPLTGVGLGKFGDQYQTKYILKEAKEPYLNHAHNNFFQVTAENGFVGLGAFLFMFAANYKEQFIFWRKTKSKYSLMILAMTTCMLLQGCTQYNFGDSAVIKNYWLMLALCLAVNRMLVAKNSSL